MYKELDHSKALFRALMLAMILSFCTVPAIAAENEEEAETEEANPSDFLSAKEYQVSMKLALDKALGRKELASPYTRSLREFYVKRHYVPAWVTRYGLNRQARQVLKTISAASEEGLNPSNYALDRIASLHESKVLEDVARLEALVSLAVIEYAADMHFGQTPADTINKIKNPHGSDRLKYAKAILETATENGDMEGLVLDMAEYAILKATLAKYRKIAEQGGLPTLTEGDPIEPGQQDRRIAILQDILIKTGEFSGGSLRGFYRSDRYTYNYPLVEAVRTFQRHHGLWDDGVIGPETVDALNLPVEERIAQIIATMERMRWFEDDKEGRYILVNVPGYYLKAVSAGKKELEMKVIVGRDSRPTPLFSNIINAVVFSPTWGVPDKIAATDMLPRIKKDPTFLAKQGFQLLAYNDGETQAVNPEEINWEKMEENEFISRYRLHQKPGEDNALGRVKFMIPDSSSIYLHGTSTPVLFEQVARSFSSGCIRVEYPKELTHFILAENSGWDVARIDETYDTFQKPLYTALTHPVPVHLVYWTVWVDDDEQVHFSPDIYNKNAKLVTKLLPAETRNNAVRMASIKDNEPAAQ